MIKFSFKRTYEAFVKLVCWYCFKILFKSVESLTASVLLRNIFVFAQQIKLIYATSLKNWEASVTVKKHSEKRFTSENEIGKLKHYEEPFISLIDTFLSYLYSKSIKEVFIFWWQFQNFYQIKICFAAKFGVSFCATNQINVSTLGKKNWEASDAFAVASVELHSWLLLQ